MKSQKLIANNFFLFGYLTIETKITLLYKQINWWAERANSWIKQTISISGYRKSIILGENEER